MHCWSFDIITTTIYPDIFIFARQNTTQRVFFYSYDCLWYINQLSYENNIIFINCVFIFLSLWLYNILRVKVRNYRCFSMKMKLEIWSFIGKNEYICLRTGTSRILTSTEWWLLCHFLLVEYLLLKLSETNRQLWRKHFLKISHRSIKILRSYGYHNVNVWFSCTSIIIVKWSSLQWLDELR